MQLEHLRTKQLCANAEFLYVLTINAKWEGIFCLCFSLSVYFIFESTRPILNKFSTTYLK
jgi:hypothetical protein